MQANRQLRPTPVTTAPVQRQPPALQRQAVVVLKLPPPLTRSQRLGPTLLVRVALRSRTVPPRPRTTRLTRQPRASLLIRTQRPNGVPARLAVQSLGNLCRLPVQSFH